MIVASRTVRVMGPTVSCVSDRGITPARLISPWVGRIPTQLFAEAGHTIDPPVSDPTVIADILAAAAAAEPELDPCGLRSSAYGHRVCPPRPLHPLTAFD